MPGSKPGERRGGRQKGVPNKSTRERQEAMEAAQAAIAAVNPEAFQGDAHALLMAVYKDPAQEWNLRIDAAKAAIKFEKPALSSVEAKVSHSLEDMPDDQLDAAIRDAATAAGLLAH